MKTSRLSYSFSTFSFIFEGNLNIIMRTNRKIKNDIFNSPYNISRLAGREQNGDRRQAGHRPPDPPSPPPPPPPPDPPNNRGPEPDNRPVGLDPHGGRIPEQIARAPAPPPHPPPAPRQQSCRRPRRRKTGNIDRLYRRTGSRRQARRLKRKKLRVKATRSAAVMEEHAKSTESESEPEIKQWLRTMLPEESENEYDDDQEMDTSILDEDEPRGMGTSSQTDNEPNLRKDEEVRTTPMPAG